MVWSSLTSSYYLRVGNLEVTCLRWVTVRLLRERNYLFIFYRIVITFEILYSWQQPIYTPN